MVSTLDILAAKKELEKVIRREMHEAHKQLRRLEGLESERTSLRPHERDDAVIASARSSMKHSLFFRDKEQQVLSVICRLYQDRLSPEQWEAADVKERIRSLQKARELMLQDTVHPSAGDGEAMSMLLDEDFAAHSDAGSAYAKLYQALNQKSSYFPMESRLSIHGEKLWEDIEKDYASILKAGFEKSYRDFKNEAVTTKDVSSEPKIEVNSLEEKLAEFPRIDNRQPLEQTLKECNPKYKKGRCWIINCQRCVPTYEMRERGYDVTAKPKLFEIDYLSLHPFDVWENPEIHSTHGDGIAEIEDFLRKTGDGTRVQITAINKFGMCGHTFAAQIKGGVISFIDPQDGNMDMRKYFKYVKPDSVKFCRIDNVKVSSLILDCCEGVNRA